MSLALSILRHLDLKITIHFMEMKIIYLCSVGFHISQTKLTLRWFKRILRKSFF